MKRKLLVALAILAVTCCVGTAGADVVLPVSPGVPPPAIDPGNSDTLYVFWSVTSDGTTTTYSNVRSLVEQPGESVTDHLIFPAAALNQNLFPDTNAYLLDPGTQTPGSTPFVNTNGITVFNGNRSDTINFNVSNENFGGISTQAVHFTLNSDEEPGNQPNVDGLFETNGYVDVTGILFTHDQLNTLASEGFSVQVLVFSDAGAVPLPPSALLLGAGLLGLVGLGWRKRS